MNFYKNKYLEDIGCPDVNVGKAEFVRRWIACAIFHAIGYILENEAGNDLMGKHG